MNMYYHRQKTTVGLSSLTLGNRSKTDRGFPTMMRHWLTTLLLFNRFLYCIVVQSNINYKLFELHCNCRSKCILFKLNNTIYIAWEKSHTSLLAMKMKVSLILTTEENFMYMYLLQHYKWMKFSWSTNHTPIHTSTFSKMIIWGSL